MLAERRRQFSDLTVQHSYGRIGLEWKGPCQQTIEDHADRIQIRPSVDFLGEHLFRRHVGRRPYHVTVHGHVFGTAHARHAEVHDLDAAGVSHHHVRGLHVAMHHAGAMGMFERRQDPIAQVGGAGRGQRSHASGELLEGLAADQLHHHQELRLRAEQLVDGGDFRVIEPSEDRRFGAEALQDVGLGKAPVEGLDGHFAPERLVHGPVDHARAAPAKLSDNPVFAGGCADHDTV
jgi:hypothetical protein